MHLNLNDEQRMLARTARDFADRHSPIARLRASRYAHEASDADRAVWARYAELGWTALHLPEEAGGLGLGYMDLGVVLEALGRNLNADALVTSHVLGAELLLRTVGAAEAAPLLEPLAAGTGWLAVAHDERAARGRRLHVTARLDEASGAPVLTGDKLDVIGAIDAEYLIVSARLAGGATDAPAGLRLCLVRRDAAGVQVTPLTRIDGRRVANVRFERAPVERVLAGDDAAAAALGQAMDRATAALCAQMLGAAQHAFEITTSYLKTRVQFGVPIGSFQALQHRASKLFVEIELARTATLAALAAIDADHAEQSAWISAAKAACNDTLMHVCHEGIQMHGGVGVTDEYDIGLFLKRAHADRVLLGDTAWHQRRWATLRGY